MENYVADVRCPTCGSQWMSHADDSDGEMVMCDTCGYRTDYYEAWQCREGKENRGNKS